MDLELCIRPGGGGRARAAGAVDTPAFAAAAARSPGWRRAGEYLCAWADPRSALHDTVAVVWLEFDVPEIGDAEPFLVFTLATEPCYPDGRVEGSVRLPVVLREVGAGDPVRPLACTRIRIPLAA